MKKLVMIVALLVSASISAMADDIVNTVNGVAVSSSNPNVATPMEAQAKLPQQNCRKRWLHWAGI